MAVSLSRKKERERERERDKFALHWSYRSINTPFNASIESLTVESRVTTSYKTFPGKIYARLVEQRSIYPLFKRDSPETDPEIFFFLTRSSDFFVPLLIDCEHFETWRKIICSWKFDSLIKLLTTILSNTMFLWKFPENNGMKTVLLHFLSRNQRRFFFILANFSSFEERNESSYLSTCPCGERRGVGVRAVSYGNGSTFQFALRNPLSGIIGLPREEAWCTALVTF